MKLFKGMRTDQVITDLLAKRNPDDEQTELTATKLLQIGPAAVPKILESLAVADKPQTLVMVEVLTQLVSPKTLQHYFKALASEDKKVLSGAAWALSRSSDFDPNKLIDLLDDEDTPNSPVLQVIAQHKEKVDMRKLIGKAYDMTPEDQEYCMRVVGDATDEALVPELISRASGKDPMMRAHIIRILEDYPLPEVQHCLQNLLADKSKLVRQAALSALGHMAEKIDIKTLCALLLDPEIDVQNKAVEVIVKVAHPDTHKYLIDALKHESEYTRRSAVEVLNALGNENNLKFLFSVLKDDDWWVRSRATDALANIGGPKVVNAVMKLMQDPDEGVRRASIEILNVTKDERALTHLIKATTDNDWWVRERAADALGDMGKTQAVPALVNMLKNEPKSTPAAIRALVKMHASQAINSMLPLVEDPNKEVQIEVVNAIAKLAEEKHAEVASRVIGTLSEHSDDEVREAALTALTILGERFSATIISKSQAAEKMAEPAHTLLMEGSKVQSIIESHKVKAILDINNLQEGDVIEERYKYMQRIGKGAFGTVILVEDTVVQENLVLKFLNKNIAEDEEMMQRFVHELRYSRKITHKNVIRIYDFLFLQGLYAISMEFFPSHTLSKEIPDNKPLSEQKGLSIGRDIATGMAVAHQVGIVHRDLKPANVLINDEGLVKVVDFGVAAAQRSGDTQLTKTGYVIGSPKYMAPEQILGKPIDERADIYSLGIILYELLCGQPPYSKGDQMAVMYQHVQGKAERLDKMNKKLSPQVVALVHKAMNTDKAKRFQSMNEFREHIEKLLK